MAPPPLPALAPPRYRLIGRQTLVRCSPQNGQSDLEGRVDTVVAVLASIHDVRFYQRPAVEARAAIVAGDFDAFRREFPAG